ncbi:MAG: hypothetical protein D8M61_21070 [Ignavibacteriae bacterium]|nr:hypothetical protein [Ignavibacteriota bacterium]
MTPGDSGDFSEGRTGGRPGHQGESAEAVQAGQRQLKTHRPGGRSHVRIRSVQSLDAHPRTPCS